MPREALPGQNVRSTVFVHQDPPHVIAEVVLRVLADVFSYDKRIIVMVVLQPNVSCRESYWDVGPWQMKVLARANVRHASVVVLLLPLRLVHRLIGSAEGVYDCGGWNACAGVEGWKDW
jgi:hypothetical protein